jgi:hypothetical protein
LLSWFALRSVYSDLPGALGKISEKTGSTSEDCIKFPVIDAVFSQGNTTSSVPFILVKPLAKKRSVVWTFKQNNQPLKLIDN